MLVYAVETQPSWSRLVVCADRMGSAPSTSPLTSRMCKSDTRHISLFFFFSFFKCVAVRATVAAAPLSLRALCQSSWIPLAVRFARRGVGVDTTPVTLAEMGFLLTCDNLSRAGTGLLAIISDSNRRCPAVRRPRLLYFFFPKWAPFSSILQHNQNVVALHSSSRLGLPLASLHFGLFRGTGTTIAEGPAAYCAVSQATQAMQVPSHGRACRSRQDRFPGHAPHHLILHGLDRRQKPKQCSNVQQQQTT